MFSRLAQFAVALAALVAAGPATAASRITIGSVRGEQGSVFSKQLSSALCATYECVPRSQVTTDGKVDFAKMRAKNVSGILLGDVVRTNGSTDLHLEVLVPDSWRPARTWTIPIHTGKKLDSAALDRVSDELSDVLSAAPPVVPQRREPPAVSQRREPPVASQRREPSPRAAAARKCTEWYGGWDCPQHDSSLRVMPKFELRFFHYWETQNGRSGQLDSEGGLMFGLGADSKYSFGSDKLAFVGLDWDVFFGGVTYNGGLQNAAGVEISKLENTTQRIGFEAWPTAGYVFKFNQFRFTPSGGIGFESWARNLAPGPGSYDEDYFAFFLMAKARGDYQVSLPVGVHLTFAIEMPLTISETSNAHGDIPALTVSPGLSPAFLVEAGMSYYRFEAMLYFYTWTMTQSPVVIYNAAQGLGIDQPNSSQTIVGIRLGYDFDWDFTH